MIKKNTESLLGQLTLREKIQHQALQTILQNKSGILHISPRVGKTKILIEAFKDILTPSHVISVPYNTIEDTWHEEASKWGLETKLNVINQRSLEKIDYSPDLLVIDEIHSLSDNQIIAIQLMQPKRIIGLSGTLSPKSKSRLKKELQLKVLFEYTIENAIKDNIISNYEINVVYLPLNKTDRYIKAGSKKKSFLTTEFAQYEYLTKCFNRAKIIGFKDRKKEFLKYKWAGERSRLIYGAKSKLDLIKRIISRFKNERKLIFTVLTDVADSLAKFAHHSKRNENNLSNFIDGKIDELAVCNMVDMGRPYMPL